MSDERLHCLARWLRSVLGEAPLRLRPASADASFRRYFRFEHGGVSHVAMDAPPQREDNRAFAEVLERLAACGLHVPRLLAADWRQGFLLLSDLGTRTYLDALHDVAADVLYADALQALVVMQAQASPVGLPPYDRELLLGEMELFRDWLVQRHLGLTLGRGETRLLDAGFALLADSALAQPRVFVHRDYHARNLMYVHGANPGILDFQDAVQGPVSYDLVSLLKDCYVRWPPARVQGWVESYLALAARHGVLSDRQSAPFHGWFERMGMQRHLKAAGIFARLWLRDGKGGYLADVPRTLDYLVEAGATDAELAELAAWVRQRVQPALQESEVPCAR